MRKVKDKGFAQTRGQRPACQLQLRLHLDFHNAAFCQLFATKSVVSS